MMIDDAGSTATAGADDSDLYSTETDTSANSVARSEEMPAKYKGKSVEDIIKMHRNAERKITEQGTELAQARKQVSEVLSLKSQQTSTTQNNTQQVAQRRTPVTVDNLLNDPESSINSAIENSQIVQRAATAEARVAGLENKLAQTAFEERYPTYAEDIQDPEFLDWMGKSKVRAALGQSASQQNFEAANELWGMWNERKELVSGVSNRDGDEDLTVVANGKQQAKPRVPATVRSAPVNAEASAGKIWDANKLNDLRYKVASGDEAAIARWKRPEFQADMIKAYQEGRVK